MQGDTGCGEHSVWWRGEGRGGPGCGEDNHGRRQRRGHQGNAVGRCFDRTTRVGFLLDETVERESKRGVLGLLEEHTSAHRTRERTWQGGEA